MGQVLSILPQRVTQDGGVKGGLPRVGVCSLQRLRTRVCHCGRGMVYTMQFGEMVQDGTWYRRDGVGGFLRWVFCLRRRLLYLRVRPRRRPGTDRLWTI